MNNHTRLVRCFLFQLLSFCFIQDSHAIDTLRYGDSIRDYDKLKSSQGLFELGFFSIGPSGNRYLGIWYDGITTENTVVWVANRENPFTDTSGILTVDGTHGRRLIVSNQMGMNITLFSDSVLDAAKNLTLKLLDTGNLVLRDEDAGQLLWQSIDYPCNAFLPGMKLGINRKTHQVWKLTSWLNPEVPAPGAFSMSTDLNGTKKLVVQEREVTVSYDVIGTKQLVAQGREVAIWTSGTWDGSDFKFMPWIKLHLNFSFVSNEEENYFIYHDENSTFLSIWVMNSTGEIVQYHRNGDPGRWDMLGLQQAGSCATNTMPVGCLGTLKSKCSEGDEFIWWSKASVQDMSSYFTPNSNVGPSDCELHCRMDCSCLGYATIYDNHTGCYLMGNESLPNQKSEFGQNDVYSRISSESSLNRFAEAPKNQPGGKNKKLTEKLVPLIASVLAILLASSLACYLWRRKIFRYGTRIKYNENYLSAFDNHGSSNGNKHKALENKDPELQLFMLTKVRAATDNFSTANKLGEGGFGQVYKGKLQGGQEIAVKRLSRTSGQGLAEFKNEITLIARLQHTNLVRLLGFCCEEEEKILLYEFMPNKSLDYFLFDRSKAKNLNWMKRIHIIEGIAQGLLYLHKYSRLRVIHRDLKTGNILLDSEMNPKISDFGMARIFDKNKSEANTNRVVGTYGYMSPEYAMEGLFSEKSDVFSFGVIMLEIVSGKKNTSFHNSSHYQNLLGFAWELWKDGKGLELMDPAPTDSTPLSKVMRCIHVGLLCVQEIPMDRPTVSDVLFMLNNEAATVPFPKLPAFALGYRAQTDLPANQPETCSINEVTVSEVKAR